MSVIIMSVDSQIMNISRFVLSIGSYGAKVSRAEDIYHWKSVS